MAKSEKENKKSDTLIAENRKARFNYSLEDTIEAGIVLHGTEVKACRAHKVNLSDGYCAFRGTELFLQNVHISEYSHGNRFNHNPRRARKLLLKKRELQKLINLWNGGMAIFPLKMYLKKSYVKILVGFGKGKKQHDKRQDLKKKQADREIARSFRR